MWHFMHQWFILEYDFLLQFVPRHDEENLTYTRDEKRSICCNKMLSCLRLHLSPGETRENTASVPEAKAKNQKVRFYFFMELEKE